MKQPTKFTFSLLTLFLLIVIAGLSASHVAMMRRMREVRAEAESVRQQALRQMEQAQAEVDLVRREFGYLQIDDPQRIHIARIESSDGSSNRYRMHIPPGHRFLLHLADTEFSAWGPREDPKPTRTMVMGWGDGADVILSWSIRNEKDGTRRVKVFTDSEPLFDYRTADWSSPPFPNSGMHLETDPRKTFSPDEKIQFMANWNDKSGRGVMLWMEPLGKKSE
jgi:hypothetical protein